MEHSQLEEPRIELSQVVTELRNFLMPVVKTLVTVEDFNLSWEKGGPWATKK